jgi:hypothetical protein
VAISGVNARLEAGLVVTVPDPDAAAEAAARTGHDEATRDDRAGSCRSRRA